MAYLNTNDIDIAIKFLDYINKKMLEKKGYMGAKFTSRVDKQFIEKYGKYRVGLNNHQSMDLEITPEKGSMFTSDEVRKKIESSSHIT